MLTCKQASQLISQSLDRKLSWHERFVLRLHLLICKYCLRFSQQLQTLRVALKRMSADIAQKRKTIDGLNTRLNNADFVAKAPVDIISKEKERLESLSKEIYAQENILSSLT